MRNDVVTLSFTSIKIGRRISRRDYTGLGLKQMLRKHFFADGTRALWVLAFLLGGFLGPLAAAQEQAKAPLPKEPAPKIVQQPVSNPLNHRFWDKKNDWLFAGVAASRTLDYFSTLNMRRRGRDEIFLANDVVDNHAAFAAIEAATTGVSIGAAYLFHRYHHHKLERWVSIVHFSVATAGSVRNYCLKTAHPAATPP
jgi:hypothetical protein